MVSKKERYSQKGFIDLASLGIVLLVISALALPAWLRLKGTRVTTQQRAVEPYPINTPIPTSMPTSTPPLPTITPTSGVRATPTPTATITPTPTLLPTATLTPIVTLTATPTMSAVTYTINSNVICPTGKTLTGQVRNFYAFWPLPAPTPAEILDWQYRPYSVGPHSITLTTPEGGHYTMGIYFGMETQGEVALRPIGTPPHSGIEYAEHFNPQTWMAHWKRSQGAGEGVPAGTYEIVFQGNDEVCSVSTTSPTPTPTEALCECPAGKPPKSMGNANCDAVVDGQDFETWREEFRQIVHTKAADFNCDDKVDGPDYEIWRSNRWITAIINQFAREENVPVNEVTVKSVLQKTWSDTCLECLYDDEIN